MSDLAGEVRRGAAGLCEYCRVPEAAFFLDHRLERFAIEAEIGDHLLQAPVLVLQCPEAFRLTHVHAALLRLPVVGRLIGDAQLAGKILRRRPASSCFTASMICSSVYFVFFISKAPFSFGALQIMSEEFSGIRSELPMSIESLLRCELSPSPMLGLS